MVQCTSLTFAFGRSARSFGTRITGLELDCTTAVGLCAISTVQRSMTAGPLFQPILHARTAPYCRRQRSFVFFSELPWCSKLKSYCCPPPGPWNKGLKTLEWSHICKPGYHSNATKVEPATKPSFNPKPGFPSRHVPDS